MRKAPIPEIENVLNWPYSIPSSEKEHVLNWSYSIPSSELENDVLNWSLQYPKFWMLQVKIPSTLSWAFEVAYSVLKGNVKLHGT